MMMDKDEKITLDMLRRMIERSIADEFSLGNLKYDEAGYGRIQDAIERIMDDLGIDPTDVEDTED
jgi:hypothetical protein